MVEAALINEIKPANIKYIDTYPHPHTHIYILTSCDSPPTQQHK